MQSEEIAKDIADLCKHYSASQREEGLIEVKQYRSDALVLPTDGANTREGPRTGRDCAARRTVKTLTSATSVHDVSLGFGKSYLSSVTATKVVFHCFKIFS